MDLGAGDCGTHRDLQVVLYGRCQKGDVSGRWCVRGRRLRFQLLNLVKLYNKSCCFIIFTGCPSVSEGTSNSNDLFNLPDICVATVDVITHSDDGRDNGSVGSGVVSEGDSHLHPSERCANGGTTMWNCWYRGCDVFLVGVVELTGGGLVRVWEVAVPDADKSGGHGVLYV